MNQARVRSGMMFAAVPPSWMIPWTRASGRSCWRHSPTELNSRIIASSAFWPFHGSAAAWAWRPCEHDVDVLRRERLALDVVPVAGVEQQRRVDAREQAVLDHLGLAAPPLLRRAAEEHDLAGQLVGDRGERDRGADARRGHRVVAAAVTEAGQGVVLGEDPDPRAVAAATAAARRPDRGRRACPPASRPRTVPRELFGDPGRGLALLEGDLGIGVDPVRQVEDLVAVRLDGGGEARLRLGVGRRRDATLDRGPLGTGRLRGSCETSALDRQRRLGDRDEREDEQGDRRREDLLRRRTTKRAVTRNTQPPRRIARVQSPRYAIRRWRAKTTSQNSIVAISPADRPSSRAPT